MQTFVFQRPDDHSGDILDVHSAHPLASAPEFSAKAQFEQRAEKLERTALAKHETDANKDDADTAGCGACRLRFPFAADVSKKSIPSRRKFVDQILAGITIEADRRSIDQHTWWLACLRDSFHEAPCSQNAALVDTLLLFLRPKTENRLARQVYDRIETADVRDGSEFKAAGTGAWMPRKSDHLNSFGATSRRNSRANEPAHSSNAHLHTVITIRISVSANRRESDRPDNQSASG